MAICNPALITNNESEKISKYELLADQIKQIYKLHKVKTIPFVMGFDATVPTSHSKYTSFIKMDRNTEAYLQTRVMKHSTDMITNESRSAPDIRMKELEMKRRRLTLMKIAEVEAKRLRVDMEPEEATAVKTVNLKEGD